MTDEQAAALVYLFQQVVESSKTLTAAFVLQTKAFVVMTKELDVLRDAIATEVAHRRARPAPGGGPVGRIEGGLCELALLSA